MIRKTGKEVLFSPITYYFDNETDADGFLKCVKGANGRPAACAATWRCIGEERRERAREAAQEPVLEAMR